MKPNLYVNESLTPKLLRLFKMVWNSRKYNRNLFQQLYTKDGKICIKLKCSNQKYYVITEEDLNNLFDRFPALKTKSSA